MNPTTLKNTADDAAVATSVSRNLAALIDRERAKGADPGWLRAAEASMTGWDGQARNANAALMRQIADAPAGPPTWGQAFTASAAWRNRTGYVTTAARLDGYLEERSAPLIPGSGRAAVALAPIAARCGAIPAGPGAATVIRWGEPLRSAEQTEGDLKAAAGTPPATETIVAPTIGSWLPVDRSLLDDEALLAALIDGRLRRALGLSLDDRIAGQLDADDDIPAVAGDDLPAAVLASIGALAADGWAGNLAVIASPADYPALGAAITHLAALGVAALLPSAELPGGAAIVADLNAAVLLRVVGGASVMVADSHAEMFLENRLVILAEQRVASAVSDPWAARRATTTAGTARTAAPKTRGRRAA